MSQKPSKAILVPAVLAGLIALSVPAYPADNATITGDDVNVRDQPAIWERIEGTLDKGTRVEVVQESDFTETIDGYTAPWYFIKCGELWGFVFGRYIAPDPGTTVPPSTRNFSSYVDPIERFIQQGLHVFGVDESAIIKTLGRPVSITERKLKDNYILDGYVIDRRLTYRDIVIEIRKRTEVRPGNLDDIYKISITTGAYEFSGLKVGSTVADVERVLGAPAEETGESLTYHDSSMGVHDAVFKIRDGVVIEIILDTTYND